MNLRRYFYLYTIFIRQSLIQQMQYRSHFILDATTTLLWGSMRIIFYWVAFDHITTVSGWTRESALLLAGSYLVVQALYKLFFERNFYNFATKVYHGELDPILLKPVSAQFYLSFREFRVSALIRLTAAIILLVFAVKFSNIAVSLIEVFCFIWAVLIALLVIFSLSYITLCTIFWLGNIENIFHFFGAIISDSFIPFDIFPKVITGLISFVIPLIFIATIPAKIFSGISILWLAYGTVLGLCFFWLSRAYWRLALKNYTSVSN